MSEFSDRIRKRAADTRASEDFARFSDAQIDAWQPSYDPNSGGFYSEGAPGQLVDKPTDCPHGTTLHGSKCISWEQANAMFGGGYGGVPQAGAAQPMAQPWSQPLQGMMAGLPQVPQPGVMPNTGENQFGRVPTAQDLGQLMAGYQSLPKPMESATQSLMGALPGMQKASPAAPVGIGTGWSAGQDGLTQMMARRQKGGQQGWWV